MECVLLLVTLAQKWKVSLAPGHLVEPQPLITLRPRYGMQMLVEARNELSATSPPDTFQRRAE